MAETPQQRGTQGQEDVAECARLADENGKLRVEVATGFGGLRTEMVERNADLLKWILIFGVTQTAAIVGLIKLWP